MPEQEQNSGKPNDLDAMLDAALARYSAVEPRAGLDERILANLRSEHAPPTRSWWQWSIAGAVAVALIIGVVLTWKSSRQPVIANHPVIAVPSPSHERDNPAPQPQSARLHPAVRSVPRMKRPQPASDVAEANPKLETFPSPQPLTEQEKILARYVDHFHDEAVLIARVRTEASKRDLEAEMQEAQAGSRDDEKAR